MIFGIIAGVVVFINWSNYLQKKESKEIVSDFELYLKIISVLRGGIDRLRLILAAPLAYRDIVVY